jgi:ribosomal protein L3
MAEGLMGRKRGMTQVFSEKGQFIPVTVLEVGQKNRATALSNWAMKRRVD